MKFRIGYISFFLLFTTLCYCQLPGFTLHIATTNETCDNNGTLTITTSNTTTGAELLHHLYKLPNLTTPIDEFTNPVRGQLDSGDYRLIVTQTLGTQSSTPEQADFTIIDQIIELDFNSAGSTVASCDTDGGIITVNVISGRGPFQYELLTGPEVRPFQTSNVFTGLQTGQYDVRVMDSCGNARVKGFLLLLDSTDLNISLASSPVIATSCTTIEVNNSVTPTPGTSIIYPLSITYTIHLPSGDQIITDNITSGPADVLKLSQTLPLLQNTIYTYDIVLVDSCLFSYPLMGNEVNPNIRVLLSDTPNICGDKVLNVSVSNFMPTYTITFLEAPAGFVPVNFNAGHTAPFSIPVVNYGAISNPVPLGFYKVRISDNCGRSVESIRFEVVNPPPVVNKNEAKATCANPLGSVRLSISQGRLIAAASIIAAPNSFTAPLPSNVSPPTAVATLNVQNLPVGQGYQIVLTDNCGRVYPPISFEIEPYVATNTSLLFTTRPSCIENMASIRVRVNNSGRLSAVTITAAPPGFGQTLPFNATPLINPDNGILFLNQIPAGSYTFVAQDNCGLPQTENVVVPVYDPGVNNYNLQRNCGSFHITVTDNSNFPGTYWFQHLDPVTNQWEHPDTGIDYTNPLISPNALNAIEMMDDVPRFNQTYLGTFRILKVFLAFDNGNTNCFQEYGPFHFTDDLQIIGAYTLDCIGGSGPSTVYLDVEGVPPYKFRIIKKNGLPFTVENGGNNIFTNLENASYDFQVEDNCGNLRPLPVNPGNLLPLVNAGNPTDQDGHQEILVCGQNGQTTATFNLNTFKASILGNQSPDNYTITYHRTSTEAATGTNPLSESHTTLSSHETIYVRVMHKTIGICYDVTSFDLYVGEHPVINTSPDAYVCDGDDVTISADPGFDAYLWSTGETTSSITVEDSGVYTVVGMNMYGTSTCESDPKNITVAPSGVPISIDFNVMDWTEHANSLLVTARGNGVYEYSLDGQVYQSSNLFEGLDPGVYKVFVRDTHGCGLDDKQVVLLNYPKFFTPNGDGFNDKWQIKYSIFEPNMNIYIFDRYGKLITGFDSKSPGWDGTYMGRQMPSTDYWFVVERADGRVLKGHFAMKR